MISPQPRFHLTARPWQPLKIPVSQILDRIEGIVRFSLQHQDPAGAIIDPFLKKEHQYATPYYAHALGVLLQNGRANDLLNSGIRALDWATLCFAQNHADGHNVFYLPAIITSLPLYAPVIPPATLDAWRTRMQTPVTEARNNNWITYLMLGEWLRVQASLLDRKIAVDFIESNWLSSQRNRVALDPLNLYHDLSSSPDTLAVEVVGRANLLALIHHGYDGPSAPEIRLAAETGTHNSLLLQDPSGQMPCNGRTDDHVWTDAGYLLAFQIMARRSADLGNHRLAAQYHHAALLAFQNLDRWRRCDPPWAGSYFVTKNHFPPELRIGYQNASQYSNYNGSLMHHLADAVQILSEPIAESPAPVEIGGYAFALDDHFASAFANAGGMQLQFDLQADTALSSGNPSYWNALGLVRIGRTTWDTRLGPADAVRDGPTGLGVSFAPTFKENGNWIRLASIPDRYEAKFTAHFIHSLLVRCTIDYLPRPGKTGPAFRQHFTITPDGILASLTRTTGSEEFAATIPLLSNDGRPLLHSTTDRIASTQFTAAGDQQNFIVLNPDATLTPEPPLRSTFGDLIPVRAQSAHDALHIFIYPASPTDPPPHRIRDSFKLTPTGFTSELGTVDQNLYLGRTSAGGIGELLQIPGHPPLRFSPPCGFLAQLAGGKIIALETDRDTSLTLNADQYQLSAFAPLNFPANDPTPAPR